MSLSFSERRRQDFLSEQHWLQEVIDIPEVLSMHASGPSGAADSEAEGWTLSLQSIARIRYEYLSLKYTAGEPIHSLRADLDAVVTAHEAATEQLRKYERNPNAIGLDIGSFDGYCPCVALIGLCYLLDRRDVLPRIAALLDGQDKANAGMDFLIEELLAYAPMDRYACDTLLAPKPFESLADAMSTDDNEAALKDLHRFLGRWYRDLAGAPWHNTHKSKGQAGYFGYWSFEAGAAALLLGIEDDSALHSFPYYPMDLVAWAKANVRLQADEDTSTAFARR
ncbi:PoNe immunity protein domain-containing protein [Cupriavidus gilardii]|uniref:PoNe immunity protein domain-containing protein n=1 Tax=Cupriavidus gilardii TaxID=82541 RepID=UPI0007E4BFF9|nr:PoNe immunity protein domain-containing protein [Cupriavidus gilardii]